MGDAGDVVHGLAQADRRHAARRGQRSGRAVDGDDAARRAHQQVDVAVLDEHHAAIQPQPGRDLRRHRPPVPQAVVQRVPLHDQVQPCRGMARERGQDFRDRCLDPGIGRVHPDLVVAVQLQREHHEGPPGALQPAADGIGPPPGRLAPGQAAQPAGILHHRVPGPVGPVAREQRAQRHGCQVVGQVLPRPAAEAGGHALRRIGRRRQGGGGVQVVLRVPRQAGQAVDAADLQRHPVGAHVAFLEHMHLHQPLRGQGAGGLVQRPAVAEQHDVGDAAALQQRLQVGGPAGQAAAVVHRTGPPPKQPVAAMEVDAVDAVAAGRQCVAQVAEERAGQALKEQELPGGRLHHRVVLFGVILAIQPATAPCTRRSRTSGLAGQRSGRASRSSSTSAGQGRPVTGSR